MRGWGGGLKQKSHDLNFLSKYDQLSDLNKAEEKGLVRNREGDLVSKHLR